MKLLLVEDQDNVRFVTSRLLERLGHEVVAVATGAEGTAAFRASPADFDAVLVDMALGDGSGLDVVQDMRTVRENVPLVLTSGSEPDEIVLLARRLAPAVALPKPFRVQELERALDRVSGRA